MGRSGDGWGEVGRGGDGWGDVGGGGESLKGGKGREVCVSIHNSLYFCSTKMCIIWNLYSRLCVRLVIPVKNDVSSLN